MTKVAQITAESPRQGYGLGTILDVKDGHALTILAKGKRLPVLAHGDHVSFLRQGDEVLFADVDGGAYIVARSRRPDEIPGYVSFYQDEIMEDNLDDIPDQVIN